MRGIISIEKIRPDGLEYPIGLSNIAGGPIFNAATNSTGGDQTMDSENTAVVHSFTSSGTFIPSFDGFVEVLIVGGGGSGSSTNTDLTSPAYGGGAGGLIHLINYPVNNGASYNVTVGAGGGPSRGGPNPLGGGGIPGTPTTFGTLEAFRGQGGGNTAPGIFGSGGGNAPYTAFVEQRFSTPTSPFVTGLGTQGQGFPAGAIFGFTGGSGGGGAGSPGFPVGFPNSATANLAAWPGPASGVAPGGAGGGAGGKGLYFSISGTSTGYAGGGGGYNKQGPVGISGSATEGGSPAGTSPTTIAGDANRGGGGGAGLYNPSNPPFGYSQGGSGVVIVRYSANQSTTFLESVIN